MATDSMDLFQGSTTEYDPMDLVQDKDYKVEKKKLVPILEKLSGKTMEQLKLESPIMAQMADASGQLSGAMINQGLLGLPEATLQKMGYTLGKPSTTAGKITEFIGGAAGALGGGAKSIVGGIGKALPKAGSLVKDVASGAAIGGLYTQPTEEGDLLQGKKRALGATIGATLGAAVTPIQKGLGLIPKAKVIYRRFKQPNQVPIQERIGYQVADAKQQAAQKLDDIRLTNDDAKNLIQDNTKLFAQELQTSAENTSLDFQKKLPEFFRENSKAYGARLDTISDEIASGGKHITKQDANALLDDTINALDEQGITQGRPRSLIDSLKNKYEIKAKPTDKLYEQELAQPVSFKDLFEDVKNVRKAMSAQMKAGQRYSPEDIAASILNYKFGDMVGKITPEFQKLQEAYKPVIQVMKEAGKIFKPYAGELHTKGGTNYLKTIALEKAEQGQRKLLEMLEQGSDFAKGVGKIAEPVTEKGRQLLGSREQAKTLALSTKQRMGNVKVDLKGRLTQLEGRKRDVSSKLAKTPYKMTRNEAIHEVIRKLKNQIAPAALAAGTLGTAGYLIGRKAAQSTGLYGDGGK